MVKSIQFRSIPDDLYYKLLEWKAKLKAKDWNDFLKKIIKRLESGKI